MGIVVAATNQVSRPEGDALEAPVQWAANSEIKSARRSG